MVQRRCPLCGQPGRRLADVSKDFSVVDYYRCDPCGHVWWHRKHDAERPRGLGHAGPSTLRSDRARRVSVVRLYTHPQPHSLAPHASEDYSELTDLAGLAEPTLAMLCINVLRIERLREMFGEAGDQGLRSIARRCVRRQRDRRNATATGRGSNRSCLRKE